MEREHQILKITFHERVEQKAKHTVGVHYIPVTIECDLGNDLPSLAGEGPQAKPSLVHSLLQHGRSHTVIYKVGRTASITQHTQRCLREVLPKAGESARIPFWFLELSSIPLALGPRHTHL